MSTLQHLAAAAGYIVVAAVLFDWVRIWYYQRRYGCLVVPRRLYRGQRPHRWEESYLLYKVNTILVEAFVAVHALAAVVLAARHLTRLA